MLLKQASIKQLEHELNRRKQAKINELTHEKAAIDKTIKSLSGNTPKNRVSTTITKSKASKIKKSMHKYRVINERSLKDLLIGIASDGGAHTTTEFVTTLENAGWKSTSTKPYYVVAAALASLSNKNIFRRVEKGSYMLVKNENVISNNDITHVSL